jgi:hypothetical protein
MNSKFIITAMREGIFATKGRNLSLTAYLAIAGLSVFLASAAGCSSNSEDQRARDERTRAAVAKATERAKPAIEEAGRKFGEAAHEAAHDARAAAEGARQGWKNGPHAIVDVNYAGKRTGLSSGYLSRQRPQNHCRASLRQQERSSSERSGF